MLCVGIGVYLFNILLFFLYCIILCLNYLNFKSRIIQFIIESHLNITKIVMVYGFSKVY